MWYTKQTQYGNRINVCNESNNKIYVIEYYIDDKEVENKLTNLITSAPELLSSLKELLDHYKELVNCGDCGNWNPGDELVCKNADKAINKALGL